MEITAEEYRKLLAVFHAVGHLSSEAKPEAMRQAALAHSELWSFYHGFKRELLAAKRPSKRLF